MFEQHRNLLAKLGVENGLNASYAKRFEQTAIHIKRIRELLGSDVSIAPPQQGSSPSAA